MSKTQPRNTYLYFHTNNGTKLSEGFHSVNDDFLHISTSKNNDEKHPVAIQFTAKVSKLFGSDYAHFRICLTDEDAKQMFDDLKKIFGE